jgi:chromosome condensin MukBEF MukE localization factor
MTATLDAVRRIKAKREEQLRLVEDGDEGAPLALSSDPNRSPEVEAGRKRLAGKVRTALARLSDNRRSAAASRGRDRV